MTGLLYFLAVAAEDSPIPSWALTGGVLTVPFWVWMWWTERTDRKALEAKVQEILMNQTDHFLENQRLLAGQTELARELVRRATS